MAAGGLRGRRAGTCTSLRVSASSSRSDSWRGSQQMPPLAPPKGMSMTAVFQVMREARLRGGGVGLRGRWAVGRELCFKHRMRPGRRCGEADHPPRQRKLHQHSPGGPPVAGSWRAGPGLCWAPPALPGAPPPHLRTSSRSTSGLYRRPPLNGPRESSCCTRKAWKVASCRVRGDGGTGGGEGRGGDQACPRAACVKKQTGTQACFA